MAFKHFFDFSMGKIDCSLPEEDVVSMMQLLIDHAYMGNRVAVVKYFKVLDDDNCEFSIERYLTTDYCLACGDQFIGEHDESLLSGLETPYFSLKWGAEAKTSRNEAVFRQFVSLLREFGSRERSVPFYANKLNLTPNHLSAVIRKHTGQSVMDWVNRTTITEAKVLLKNSDMKIYEIAESLNFPEPTAFNRYFKKQTGLTPAAYRKNNPS